MVNFAPNVVVIVVGVPTKIAAVEEELLVGVAEMVVVAVEEAVVDVEIERFVKIAAHPTSRNKTSNPQ